MKSPPTGAAPTKGGTGLPFVSASFRPRQLTSPGVPQGAGGVPSWFQYTSSGIAQRSGTITSPTWWAGFTPPLMPLMMSRCTWKWSSISCVTIVELIMLTPLSTMTTLLPRSVPVVKRLPLTVKLRRPWVLATRMSASAPKAETMPMRGVQSLRQRGAACAGRERTKARSSSRRAIIRGSSVGTTSD